MGAGRGALRVPPPHTQWVAREIKAGQGGTGAEAGADGGYPLRANVVVGEHERPNVAVVAEGFGDSRCSLVADAVAAQVQ